MTIRRPARYAILVSAGALALSVGLGVGAAVAGGALVQLSPEPEAPSYDVTKSGETYGSAADATSPETEPDLIRVIATNDKVGYAKKIDLDKATGGNFSTPEEAVAWTLGEGREDHVVAVYDLDGNVIGEFVIDGGR